MRRLALMFALTIVIAACGDDDAGDTSAALRTTSTTTTTVAPVTSAAPSTVPATTLGSPVSIFSENFGEVGDCVLVSYTDAGDDFDYDVVPEQVSCEQAHDQQVFFVGELEGAIGSPYPGDAIADLVFDDLCEGEFEAAFGVPSTFALSLDFWATWPSAEEWDTGLRTFKCSVAAPGNSLGEFQLVGDAWSAGLTLPAGHLLATVAEFDVLDLFIWGFGDGGELLDAVNLTDDGLEIREASSPPSWSPDVSVIAYAGELPDGNIEVFVVDAATGEKTNITNDAAGDFGPSISPDGSKIAFSSDRNSAETNIFVMGIDGSNPLQLTFDDDRDSSPDWSPDGRRIVYRKRTGGNSDIWTMNADGSGQALLVGGPAGEYDPDWSPDGSTIAFISDESGDFDIWTFPAEGVITIGAPPSVGAAGATRITDHPGNEEYPDWSPNGDFILFMSDRHGVQDVWIMRADGSDQSALLFTYPVGWPQAVLPAS